MNEEKNMVISVLRTAAATAINDCLLVSENDGAVAARGIPEMIINYQGSIRISYYAAEEYRQRVLQSGEWCFCSASGYLCPEEKLQPGIVIISFYGNSIQITMAHDDIQPQADNLIFRTAMDLPLCAQQLITIIDDLAVGHNIYRKAAPELLRALLLMTIEAVTVADNGSTGSNLWVAVNNYLNRHYSEPITRASVAGYFNVSPGYVSHLSRRFTGRKFNENLLQLRLKQAQRLLEQSQLSVNEIADACGFSYTSYFIRRFKAHYRVTPDKYRKIQLAMETE